MCVTEPNSVLPERFLEHKVMVTGWLLHKLQRLLPQPLPFSPSSHQEVPRWWSLSSPPSLHLPASHSHHACTHTHTGIIPCCLWWPSSLRHFLVLIIFSLYSWSANCPPPASGVGLCSGLASVARVVYRGSGLGRPSTSRRDKVGS